MKSLSLALILISFVAFGRGSAQQFEWQAAIRPVPSDAFYSLVLSPSITGRLQSDAPDLRIYDSEGYEVAYLHRRADRARPQVWPLELLTRSDAMPDSSATLIANPKGHVIRNLVLSPLNSSIDATIVLEGSDDRRHWRSIGERRCRRFTRDGSVLDDITWRDLPRSSYPFYRIRPLESKAPVSFGRIGCFDQKSILHNFAELPMPHLRQEEDSIRKRSIIRIDFDQPYRIDRIELDIEGPRFFQRKGRLTASYDPLRGGDKGRSYDKRLRSMDICSDCEHIVELNGERLNSLKLYIVNNDNRPLLVRGLRAYRFKEELIAFLKADEDYTLRFGNPDIDAPTYDINYFQIHIPARIDNALLDTPRLSLPPKGQDEEKNAADDVLLWTVIILVGLIVGYTSRSMLRDLAAGKR